MFTMHHIAADGWSLTPLLRDLSTAYSARCDGQAPGWAGLPVQYVDYTLWQREHLGELEDPASAIAAQLGFWERALAGLPERLELPTDRPYPLVADHRGASVGVNWSADLQRRVVRVARAHNVTSFMVIQAALAVLLCKISASSEVAVQIPDRGSHAPSALDDLVGFFVDTWFCAPPWPVIPRSKNCWLRCGNAAWPPTNTKTCPLRCLWIGSTPPEAWPITRWSR